VSLVELLTDKVLSPFKKVYMAEIGG